MTRVPHLTGNLPARHPNAILTAAVSVGLCATALTGCTRQDEPPARPPAVPGTPAVRTPVSETPAVPGTPAVTSAAQDCDVTEPADRAAGPPPQLPSDEPDRWYGEGVLWVSLPDPSFHPEKGPDGYGLKVGWWRLAEGPLTVTATRADDDGGAATMVPHIPSGYGRTGFQASGLTFSRTGCWHVTATLAGTDIDFRLRIS